MPNIIRSLTFLLLNPVLSKNMILLMYKAFSKPPYICRNLRPLRMYIVRVYLVCVFDTRCADVWDRESGKTREPAKWSTVTPDPDSSRPFLPSQTPAGAYSPPGIPQVCRGTEISWSDVIAGMYAFAR